MTKLKLLDAIGNLFDSIMDLIPLKVLLPVILLLGLLVAIFIPLLAQL